MFWLLEECRSLGNFYDLANVHDGDAVTDVLNHTEVVGDEEIGEVKLVLELQEQIQDLGLHRDVKGRHRLVARSPPGREGQGPSDADALALTAAEGMGVAVHILGRQADKIQQFLNALTAVSSTAHSVDEQRLRR